MPFVGDGCRGMKSEDGEKCEVVEAELVELATEGVEENEVAEVVDVEEAVVVEEKTAEEVEAEEAVDMVESHVSQSETGNG